MPDIRVLLFLAAGLPGTVLAQAVVPEPLLAPPLVAAPAEDPAFTPVLPSEEFEASQSEARRYALSPARMTVEVLGGAGGGVVMTLATLIIVSSSNVDRLSCRGDVCDGRLIGALAIAGCGLGSTGAVFASGELMGGQGRFLPTLVSGLVASGATAGLYYAGVDDSAKVVIPLMALPMVSSIVAYELSAALGDAPSRSVTVSPSAGVTWAPSFSLSSRGGTLGLAGRF